MLLLVPRVSINIDDIIGMGKFVCMMNKQYDSNLD